MLEIKKIFFFFVVSRTSDTENILKFCSQYKNKIFVEKPITFKKKIYIKNYKNIFVGYNRIYFNVLNKIKKIKLRNFYCNVNMSYNNFNEIKQNISHIFSCLLFLFGNLTLVKKIKNKTNKTFIFKNDANNYIFLNLLNTNADNYSINIITNKINFLFKPLEFLFIYKSIEFKFYLNNPKKMYTRQKLLKRFNEFKYNNFKPGFLNQMNAFKKFCRNKKKIINNIDFANKVLTWSWKILRF